MLRARLPLLVAVLSAAQAVGSEVTPLAPAEAVSTVCKKGLEDQCDALFTLASGGLPEKNRNELAKSRLKTARQHIQNNEEPEAKRAAVHAVQLFEQIGVPQEATGKSAKRLREFLVEVKSSRVSPELTPTAFVKAVDDLYGAPKDKLNLDQKRRLAKLVFNLAVDGSKQLQSNSADVSVRLGVLRMKQADKEGAEKEFRDALRLNREASLPPYAQEELGGSFEELRKEFPPPPTPTAPVVVTPPDPKPDPEAVVPITQKPARDPRDWRGLVAAGAGFGALVVGAVAWRDWSMNHDAERAASQAGDFPGYQASRQQALRASLAVDVSCIAAVVSGLGTYFFFSDASKDHFNDAGKGSVALTPAAGPGQASLVVIGRF